MELPKPNYGVIGGYHPAVNLDELERMYIIEALKHFNGNKTKAAGALGITLKTLYNKLHRWGMFHKTEQ